MTEKKDFLMGDTHFSLNDLYEKLQTLQEHDALELIFEPDTEQLFIPYMMNDAVEYYFILKQCQIQGTFLNKIPDDATIELASSGTAIDSDSSCNKNPFDSKRHAIIIRTPDDTTLTIWFSHCSQEIHYYQYHRIGHFWVQGQEHWRRLVYIIGTIHEKNAFLGQVSCNSTELSLLPLVEFPPFRYWSPIHDSLDHYYENSREGYLCMLRLAKEAGDSSFVKMLHIYGHLPSVIRESKACTRFMAKQITKVKHISIYKYICKCIDKASRAYDLRDYGKEHNETIERIRTQFTKELYADGYSGIYPCFQKKSEKITAMEEHPFTVLESDTFKFRIHKMRDFY